MDEEEKLVKKDIMASSNFMEFSKNDLSWATHNKNIKLIIIAGCC